MNLVEALKESNKKNNGENVLNLDITEVVLVRCNLAYNNYQNDSRLSHTFIPNKQLIF